MLTSAGIMVNFENVQQSWAMLHDAPAGILALVRVECAAAVAFVGHGQVARAGMNVEGQWVGNEVERLIGSREVAGEHLMR